MLKVNIIPHYIWSKSSRSNWTREPKHNIHTDASVECKIIPKSRNNSRCLNRTTTFSERAKDVGTFS